MRDEVSKILDSWNIEHRIENSVFILNNSKLRIAIPQVNEDIAYLLGYLCGDGHLAKPQPRKRGGNRLKISICFSGSKKGEVQAQNICNIVKRYFHYEPRVYNRKREGRKDWLRVDINSAVIYAYFYQLGLPVGKKYGKLKVPSAVYTEALFEKFLQGLIDSDGHVQKDRDRTIIVQRDMEFLDQIRRLSSKFLNVEFSIPRQNNKKIDSRTYTWYYIITYEAERFDDAEFSVKKLQMRE